MPPPAPLASIPFVAQETADLQTRRIQLGSLARMNDSTRLFWESSWMKDNTTIHLPTLSLQETKSWDILFFSREQPFVSQMIRFWTQSPFNHVAILSHPQTLVETQVNIGIVEHPLESYLKSICLEHSRETDRPFSCLVVRLNKVPQHIESTLKSLSWTDYQVEDILNNFIYMGHSDGPDHPIPIPWASHHDIRRESLRSIRPWYDRSSFQCTEMIARILELDAMETY